LEENFAVIARHHLQRLRQIYRSAGWPCQDVVEIELLAAGLLERVTAASGHESLRVTDAGILQLQQTLLHNKAARNAHEALVAKVALEMARAGRLVWRGLSLRAQVPTGDPDKPLAWCIACPDVFSIRNTTVEAYLQPIVHEIKVSRADLLGDLRKSAKRAAYLDLGGECWYVLGTNAKGAPIAQPDEIPPECAVMLYDGTRLSVARPPPAKPAQKLPLQVWMALCKATPVRPLEDDAQGLLGGNLCLQPNRIERKQLLKI
jgi:hypothetical protein